MSYEGGAVIHASAAETMPGAGSPFTIPSGSTVNVFVSVTAVGTTVTFSVEWSTDGGVTWAKADPADVFTAITTNIAVVKTFPRRAPLCRLAWVGTGSSTFVAYASVVGA